jgi:NADH:ubiquinone oxidoreductase subunit 6 (subunit J)
MSLSGLLYDKFTGDYEFLNSIITVLDEIIWPILIVLASVGTIYAIYLGVMMAKAENAEKREEAKKRIINAIIALVVMVVLILLLKLFEQYAPSILGVDKSATEGSTSSTGGSTNLIGLLKMFR